MNEEIWKRVPDWPAYEVSARGRVRSFWKRMGTRDHLKMVIGSEPKMLKLNNSVGLVIVTLGNGKGTKQITVGVANLVLRTFIGAPKEGEIARHMVDPDPWNCNLENLAWSTYTQNHADVIRHKGKHHKAKLYPKQVYEIIDRLKGGAGYGELAKEYRVCDQTIRNIETGESHKNLFELANI